MRSRGKPAARENKRGAQIPLAVGFIALAGMMAETGVLVLTFIDQEVVRARKKQVLRVVENLHLMC